MSKIHPEVIAPDASGYNKNPENLTDKKIDKKLELLGKRLDGLDEIEIHEQGSALTQTSHFQDGQRKVDYVLIYQKPKVGDEDEDVIKYRAEYLKILEAKGIQCEQVKSGQVYFVKLHATPDFLFQQAELLHLKFPFCARWQKQINDYVDQTKATLERKAREDQEARARDLAQVRHGRIGKDFKTKTGAVFTSLAYARHGLKSNRSKISEWLNETFISPIANRLTIKNDKLKWTKDWTYGAEYSKEEHDFFVDPQLPVKEREQFEANFFSQPNESDRERIRLVALALDALEFERCKYLGVFTEGYPLHDCNFNRDEENQKSDDDNNEMKKQPEPDDRQMRRHLHNHWARFSNWRLFQPFDAIQSYFGEEVALYFAFLSVYTQLLFFFSIVGVVAVIYGVITMYDNAYLDEVCNLQNVTMCPMCNDGCPFYNASDNCFSASLLHVFDNDFSIFYSCFVPLWTIIFLEVWKRRQYELTYKWGCNDVKDTSENVLPSYREKAGNNFKYRPGKMAYEVHVCASKRRQGYVGSCIALLFFILLVLVAVFSCLLFNLWMNAIYLPRNTELTYFDGTVAESFWNYEYLVTAIVTTVLCVGLIILDFVFVAVAHKMTEWECPRTRLDYINHYNFKLFCFYFVNYFTWPFYIAFAKDNLTGTPPDYTKVFGYKWQGCGPAGCSYEITIQLIIVMVIKPLFLNLYHFLTPRLMVHCKKSSSRQNIKHYSETMQTKWESDWFLLDENEVSYDYVELVIQFGFVTLFSSAFPLAALFAFINNLVEVRRDAQKYTKFHKRPVPRRVKDIGIWQPIFTFMAILSILTNVFQMTLVSEAIPKWLWRNDNDGNITGYASSKLNNISVSSLVDHGLKVMEQSKTGLNFTIIDQCFFVEDGTFNEEDQTFSHTKNYYRTLAYKLSFALTAIILIYGLFSLIEWLIADRPRHLVDRQNQIAHILAIKRFQLRQEADLMSRATSVCTKPTVQNLHTGETTNVLPTIELTLDLDEVNGESNVNGNPTQWNSPTINTPGRLTVSDMSVLVETPRDSRLMHFDPRNL